MSRSHTALFVLLVACDAPLTASDGGAVSADAVPLPGSLTTASWSSVQAQIGADARPFQAAKDGSFAVGLPRRHQARIDAQGAVLSRGDRELAVSLAGYGRADDWLVTAPAEPIWGSCAHSAQEQEGCVLRVEQPRDGLTEWWVGRGQGLQQGWTIEARPGGQGDLSLEVVFEGGFVEVHGEDITVLSADGQLWRYGQLAAWDAAGAPLLSWLEADGERAWIVIDDRQADYPITIDPIVSAEETKVSSAGGSSYTYVGFSVSSAGDVNGDGYADVVAGAYGDSGFTGAAHVFYGSSSGITTTQTRVSASNGSGVDYFGYSSSGAGDLDGDGYDDIIVGAWAGDGNSTGDGSAYVYYGSSSGLLADSEQQVVATDGASSDQFGASVSGAGDINGDGYDDVIVGMAFDDDNDQNSGSAYVYYGSSTGLQTATAEKITASDGDSYDYFGVSVAGAGDVNGDGYDDIIVGAHTDEDNGTNAGAAYVYYGSSTGIATDETKLLASDGESSDVFGLSVAGVGDLNGDGYGDVLVGAYGDDDNGSNAGAAYVYYGSSSGVLGSTEDKLLASDGDADDRLGQVIGGAGDVDGDGYNDVILGAYKDDDVTSDAGAAYVYHGSSTGIATDSEEKLLASDGGAGDGFGISVSGAGDVDGDGIDDVAVGAYHDDDSALDAGAVYVYPGTSDADGDGVDYADDCDDSDTTIGGGATWYPDADGDGYGDQSAGEAACEPPSGYVEVGGDCDDSASGISPGATETCGDGIDSDCDGDGGPDGDDDGDGLSYTEEVKLGTDDCTADSDKDGLSDGDEVNTHGSDPNNADSDADGLSDGDEVNKHGTDPSSADSDADGLSDAEELTLGGDPNNADTDGDGVSDGDEVANGTEPDNADSDGDGLSDGDEATVGTDPLDDDTDDDGILDGEDANPLVADSDDDDDDNDGDDNDDDGDKSGCSTTGGAPAGWLALFAGLFVFRRRH